jgi:hypothetical protein
VRRKSRTPSGGPTAAASGSTQLDPYLEPIAVEAQQVGQCAAPVAAELERQQSFHQLMNGVEIIAMRNMSPSDYLSKL